MAAPKPGNIEWIGSPNHWTGRDGKSVVAIVDHIMVGTMESTRGWFNNPASQVSSTFGVAKDGRIHQYVKLEDASWANGIPQSVDTACTWLVEAVVNRVNPNNLTVSIEHEGNSGDVMPEAQYQATLALHRWLIDLYHIPVDRQHILGHYQIMRFDKANCPGPGFPWSRLMADLADSTLSHTTESTPPKPAGNGLPPGFEYVANPNNLDIYKNAIADLTSNMMILEPFASYFLNNGAVGKFGHAKSGLYGTMGSQEQLFDFAHFKLVNGKVEVEMVDRTNPQGFKVGAGIYGKCKELNLRLIVGEQWFSPDPGQPGLGKMSRAWAQDANGVTLVLMASEQPELAKPGQDTPWKVEVLEVK